MPQTKTAKKDLRKIAKRTEQNEQVRRNLDYLYRQFKKALTENNSEKMQKVAKDLNKALDKAAQKNVIHKNAAGRRKSRLMKKVNKK